MLPTIVSSNNNFKHKCDNNLQLSPILNSFRFRDLILVSIFQQLWYNYLPKNMFLLYLEVRERKFKC